ncbi:uncharacterized protein LOC101786854 [Setaria italica]|uniref:uncharacterized protein LOC101786854 n=1 Tax=Setaria italica TaxID=4555 RepID=UPI0007199E4A|nr:uncharacterized protein LOC101786854 [Setaria italica]
MRREQRNCHSVSSSERKQRKSGFLAYLVELHAALDPQNSSAPVLDLRVAPTSTDCTIEMLSCNCETMPSVYTKPFSMLPLSAVEKPDNLLMQGLLDKLVPMLGEQLLRDYHSWVQQQPEASS